MSLKIFSANDWENWIKSKLVSEDERLIPNKNSVVCKGCAPPKNTDGNCFPEIRKDPYTGNCYKACPYLCKDPVYNDSKMTEKKGCDYNSDCSGCGVRLFSWNCPKQFGPIVSSGGKITYDGGSVNKEWGTDTIFSYKDYTEPIYTEVDSTNPIQSDETKKKDENNKEGDLLSDYDLGYSELSQNIKNILEQIKELQEKEENLFTELEITTDNLEKELLLEQINSVAAQRITLYNNLKLLFNGNLVSNINTSNTLTSQELIIKNIEDELNKQKDKINKKNQDFMNKLRLVQNNTYYSKKYTDQAQLLLTLIIICIILISISFLKRLEFIPTSLITILIVLVLFIGIIIIYRKIMDMSLRNNLDYDSYDFPFNKNNVNKDTMEVIMNEYIDESESFPSINTSFYYN